MSDNPSRGVFSVLINTPIPFPIPPPCRTTLNLRNSGETAEQPPDGERVGHERRGERLGGGPRRRQVLLQPMGGGWAVKKSCVYVLMRNLTKLFHIRAEIMEYL